MKNIILVVAVAGLVAIAAALIVRGSGVGVASPPRAEAQGSAGVDCAISAGPCSSGAGDAALTLDISPRPVSSMTDLVFVVSGPAAAAPGASGVVDLQMPGMYMGANQVQLAPDGGGHLTGKGVLVRCPSGHLTWSAATTVRPRSGAPVTAIFTFDLAR